MKYLPVLFAIVLFACDKEERIINQPPEQTPLCRIVSWVDTMFTGVLRHNIFTYNEQGNPINVTSEHAGTGAEPDYFTYDSLQRLIEHRRLFTYQYLYNGSDTLPYAAIEISPYDLKYMLAFTYDNEQRIVKVVGDYIEGDDMVDVRHYQYEIVYDSSGNLINDVIASNDYTDKPSIYRTNKWWMLIHLNFSKNALDIGTNFNECEMPLKVNKAVFLGLEAGTVGYLKL